MSLVDYVLGWRGGHHPRYLRSRLLLLEIINILKTEDAPLSVDGLSNRLDVDKPALEGMLETLLQKGIIKMDNMEDINRSGCHGFCWRGCAVSRGCPFAGEMLYMYTLVDSKR
jgi:hypothetical protein